MIYIIPGHLLALQYNPINFISFNLYRVLINGVAFVASVVVVVVVVVWGNL